MLAFQGELPWRRPGRVLAGGSRGGGGGARVGVGRVWAWARGLAGGAL